MTDLTPLNDDNELLLRQVHPSFVREGRLSSQAFRPTPKDQRKLSVSRGALTTPSEAHRFFTQILHLLSAGSWAVTVGEAKSNELPAIAEPVDASPERTADPAHAFIDFRGVSSKNKAEAKGALLSRAASERGRLHPDHVR